MTDLLGSSFYAGLAGRNADQATANLRAANSATDRADRNARIAKEWQATALKNKANCESWMEYARQLEGSVRKWQADAVESEAISRVQTAVLKENTGQGLGQYVDREEYEARKAEKIREVCEEWKVNPFSE
jgi:hypothetical protein